MRQQNEEFIFDIKELKKCQYWSFLDGIFKPRTMNIAQLPFLQARTIQKKNEKRLQCNLRQRQVKIENNYLFKLIKNMETSLKTGFTQIFSSCLKNLSCPKIRRGARPMVRTDENLRALPFVRTDRPDHSRRDENSTFNQNYPARSVKS